jgi:hypothetical protein
LALLDEAEHQLLPLEIRESGSARHSLIKTS